MEAKFRGRVDALIVDEAHCIDEWGEEFRPMYRELHRLRSFTGQGVPFVACTTTCATNTFNIIRDSLGFGHRPFWGLDASPLMISINLMGCRRFRSSSMVSVRSRTCRKGLEIMRSLSCSASSCAQGIVMSRIYFCAFGQRFSSRQRLNSICGPNCALGLLSVEKKPMKSEMRWLTSGIRVVKSQCRSCRVEIDRKIISEKTRWSFASRLRPFD
ncbi:hypothetical protein B0H10DRAFT_1856041 [Mycena sp. CBHHK59/15]|nr:hypothetical protein B0H10DRAFT_1856041 [Mycena sp. CBHHK59/15]